MSCFNCVYPLSRFLLRKQLPRPGDERLIRVRDLLEDAAYVRFIAVQSEQSSAFQDHRGILTEIAIPQMNQRDSGRDDSDKVSPVVEPQALFPAFLVTKAACYSPSGPCWPRSVENEGDGHKVIPPRDSYRESRAQN